MPLRLDHHKRRMVLRRRRPLSSSAGWGGFIAATLFLVHLQQQLGPVAATPRLWTLRVGELEERIPKLKFADDGSTDGVADGDDDSTAISAPPALFSEAWEERYGSEAIGCDLGRKRYYWRQCGLGSNILRKSRLSITSDIY